MKTCLAWCACLALLLLVGCGEKADTPAPTETGKASAGTADTPTGDAPATQPAADPEMADEPCAKDDEDAGKPPAEKPTVKATWRGADTAIEFNAWRMGCSGCGNTVEKRIGKIEGVTNVEARVDKAFIRVEIDDATKRDDVIKQITAVLEAPPTGRKFKIVRADG